MILLAEALNIELTAIKDKFKSEIADLSIQVAGTSFEFSGHNVTLAAKKICCKGLITWKVTWWLDGRRVGFNALVGKLEGK